MRKHRCPKCGYVAEQKGLCPKCGTSMEQTCPVCGMEIEYCTCTGDVPQTKGKAKTI